MSAHDDDEGGRAGNDLPVVPALPAAEGSAARLSSDDTELAMLEGGPPDQLGFSLRFEAGRALLALEKVAFAPGLEIRRALFEVPDVAFPLDVTGGATRFQDRRLTLRGVELALSHETLFVPDRLQRAGLTLLRERTRPGGIELLVSVAGAGGDVPVRARGLFVAAGDAGVAVVLHEIIPFGAAPRPRLELGQLLLDALAIPGGQPARAMVRRAHPFRAVFSRLLPAYGWKVPAMGAVRVHEVVLSKGQIVLRAWAGDIPDGWKPPRRYRPGPLEEAVALALFADDLAAAESEAARLAVVDRLLDEGDVPLSVAPFAAELLRRDERRRAEGDDLVERALTRAPSHLGVLSAHVDAFGIDAASRTQRLLALGRAADQADEPWVSARAFLVAAELAEAYGDARTATEAAEAAWIADPTHGPTGALYVRLAAAAGQREAALRAGRSALERLEDGEQAESLAVFLAPLAQELEGVEAARALLRRALRRRDRVDALMALVRLEIHDGELERAAEVLARLLTLESEEPSLRADAHLLAAELAEAREDLESARLHLGQARELRPDDAELAVRQAALHRRLGDLERALEALQPLLEEEPAPAELLLAAAELRVARAREGDAEKALQLLSRAEEAERTNALARVEAEARALLGEVAPLARLLEEEATEGGGGPTAAADARKRALELYARAGLLDEAARVCVQGLAREDSAEGLAEALLTHPDAALAVAVAEAARATGGLDAAALHELSQHLARAGRAAEAHALLLPLEDLDALRTRAELAAAVGDAALERKERAALAELLDAAREGSESDAHAELSAELHGTLCRLAMLERGEGGDGPLAEAEAWSRAAALGEVDVAAWLESSLASGSAERLSEVLRRREAELAQVPSEALREVASGPWLEDAPDVRVRLLEVVAEREGGDDDAAAFLEQAAEHLPPKVAAAAYARFASRNGRPDWLLSASALEEKAGDHHAGLHRLLGALGTPLGAHLPLLDALLERSLEAAHADGIARAALAFYAAEDGSQEQKASALARASEALYALESEDWRAVTAAWLDVEPAADDALEAYLDDALAQGERAKALARLRARLEKDASLPAAVLSLLEAVAEDARASGASDDEVDARELLARAHAASERADAAISELLRIADLHVTAGDVRQAVNALARRIALGGEAHEIAACFVRIADLEEERGRDEPAADALTAALQRVREDADISRRLVTLLERAQSWERLAEEWRRRAAILPRGPERTAALVKLGDLFAGPLERPAEAPSAWLEALRSTWSDAPLSRLLNRAAERGGHRLFIRAHLAAARAPGREDRASVHAMEAGAALAGLLDRPRLAIAAYRFAAERSSEDPLPPLRALVELHRALGDVEGALTVLDRLQELTSGSARALAYEMRADLLEGLAGDLEGAEAARRAALEEEPSFRPSALALVRMLRAQGRVADAITVRRQLADAAEGPAHRAQTYAALAESARDELADLELAAELAKEALAEQPRLVSIRLLRVGCLEGAGHPREAADELGWLLEHADLPAQERVTLCRRKATLERDALSDLHSARQTLRAELARTPTLDLIADEVAAVEEELGEPAAAAQALLTCLAEHPEGTDVLGNRRQVLERVARLVEDAGDAEAALSHLMEAAERGRLSREAELARARLAERLERADVAMVSLQQLLDGEHGFDAEETVGLLGRLAVAAERAGDLVTSLAAWRERAERLPADVESLLAVERLARASEDAPAGRAATEQLVRLEIGSEEEQRERFLWLAVDCRARDGDPAAAYRWLERAAAIRVDARLLAEMLECAEAAGDRAAALEVLERLEASGEALPASALLRRAELGLEVSQDIETALASVVEALRAGEAGVDLERATAVLGAVSEAQPQALLEALLVAEEGSLEQRSLRGCLGPLARFTAGELGRLADRFSSDQEVVSAAAESEVQAGEGARAADRLLALADALDGELPDAADAHRERAAEALLGADIDAKELMARFEALKPALARDRERRGAALHLLRDAEAFDLVAELLEHALGVVAEGERRALRLELVAVLRDGLEDPARAAVWLEEQVEEDPDDREAWGELLECLDELGADERLAEALARRIARSSGLERRELIRRRAELLVRAGRGQEVLEELISARTEAPGDVALKALERAVHEAAGVEALAAFLTSELLREDAPPSHADASALLDLPATAASSEGRVAALQTLASLDAEHASQAARSALRANLPVERRVAEARATAAKLEGASLAAFVEGLAGAASRLGAEGALSLSDTLFDADIPGATSAFGLASVARRVRVHGPAAALLELERLSEEDLPSQERARVELRLALRVGDREGARAALEDAELSFDAFERVESLLAGQQAAAHAELEARAEAGLAEAARGAGGLSAAVRVADAEVLHGRMAFEEATVARQAAERARVFRLTPARLPLRLLLSEHLAEGRTDELERIASAARDGGDTRLAAEALAALMALDGPTAERARLRAELALELDEPDAAERCELAAALAPEVEEALRHRRKAVEVLVRRGADAGTLERALRALATTRDDDVELVREATRLAEAVRLPQLTEALLAEEARLAASDRDFASAVRRRSEHLRRALRRPAEAFEALLEAAARAPDEGFREEAYRLAVEEGLVEHLLEVVDDGLAQAALLGLLGRVEDARALARAIEGPAARLLEAELCALLEDVEGETAALGALVSAGQADEGTLVRLARTALLAGDAEQSLRTALALARKEARADALDVVLESLPRAEGEALAHALEVLPELLDSQRADDPRALRLLDAWSNAAKAAGRFADMRLALRRRAELVGTETAWVAWLREALGEEPAESLSPALEAHLESPAVIRALADSDAPALATALEPLMATSAGALADCLAVLHVRAPLEPPLLALLVSALVGLERFREAAELVSVRPTVTPSEGRQRQLEAAQLFLRANEPEGALEALLGSPPALVGDEERRLARALFERDPRAGTLALVRVADVTGDEGDVALALEAAREAPSEVASAVAGWRLRGAPEDLRAWELASTRGLPSARRFFAAQLALRGLGPWTESLDEDLSRAHALATREVDIPRPSMGSDALARARGPEADARALAWRELAAEARAQGAPLASARLLQRAGVSLSEAPIEVRLVADASLREPRARADALLEAVLGSGVTAPEAAPAEPLRQALVQLDEEGWLGARHREALRALGPSNEPWSALIDAADNEGVTSEGVVSALGRHPTLAERSTAAALLASLGARDLAVAILPTLFGAPADELSPAASETQEALIARLEARAEAAARAGRSSERIGILRTLAALRGPRVEEEAALRENAAAEGRWALVVESLWREAAMTEDPRARGRLLLERARRVATELRRPELALEEVKAAAELLPQDPEVMALWTELAHEAGDAREAVEVLAMQEAQASSPEERAALVVRRAALLREALSSPGAALAALDGALALIGDRGPLLVERARCFLALDDTAQAAATLMRAAAATQGEERDAFRHEAAALYEGLGDLRRACDALERSAAEGDAEARTRLESLAREHDLVEVLERALALAYEASRDVESRRGLALERAELLESRLERRAEAIALLEDQAVADERDSGARLTLAEWYLEDRRLLDAALAYESAAEIPDLPPALTGSAAREAAALLAARGDLERAGPLAERAILHGAVDEASVAVALAWYRARERWADLDATLERSVELAADGHERAAVWLERMALRRDFLRDSDASKAALHRALEAAPDYEPALEAMRAFALENDAFGQLRAALSRAAELIDDTERQVRWLREIAALDVERFDDLRAADATLERASEIAPHDVEVLVERAAVLRRLGRMDLLPPLLERAALGGATLPPDLLLIRGDALLLAGERDAARACFEEVAQATTSALDAAGAMTLEDLDLVAAEAASEEAELSVELRAKAWDRLTDLARADQDEAALALALKNAREATVAPERQARFAREELEVRLRLGDREDAVEAAHALLTVVPGDSEAFGIVKADLLRRRRLEALALLYEKWARAADDDDGAARLAELGAFLLDELGSEQAARKAFEDALALDPGEGVARIRLAEIAYAAQDWEIALGLMDGVNPGLWPRGEIALLFERAECAVKLGRDDADERLREVLRRDRAHLGALELLARVTRERGDHDGEELALEALALALDPRRAPERAAKVLGDLADLRARQGRYEDAAIAAEQALELDATSLSALERAAELYERAGRAADAAEAWRRVAALRSPGQQSEARERRARALEAASRMEEAAEIWLSLYELAGAERYREESLRLAREHNLEGVLDRLGIAAGPPTLADEGLSAMDELRRALEEGQGAELLDAAARALEEAGEDEEVDALALAAITAASDGERAVAMCEERLQAGIDAGRVRNWAFAAGRIARDKLRDPSRAAGLMYRAHQAAPEDLDIRIELTQLYARIEELVDAAQTGVEQLLRRAPADPRVYRVASEVAAAQHNLERARAMRSAEHLLVGKAAEPAPATSALAPPRGATSVERLLDTIAPSGVTRPHLDVLEVCGAELEQYFAPKESSLAGTRALADASPAATTLLARIEALLPGRPLRVLVEAGTEVRILPGSPLTLVLPEDALAHGDSVVVAHLARAVGIARLGGGLFELLSKDNEVRLLGLIRALAEGNIAYPLANTITSSLDGATATRLGDAASALMANGPPDLAIWRSAALRFADRFALVVSGSLLAALDAGPLPGLHRDSGEGLAARLSSSPRALDLCRFAARPAAWVLRRELGLAS